MVFGLTMDEWKEEYSKLFKDERSTLSFERYQEIAGFGMVPEQPSGKNVAYDDLVNGYTTDVVNVTFGKGYRVNRDMVDDEQYGQIKKLPEALAKAVRLTVETTGANIFNRAFSSTYAYGDGVELCSTSNKLAGNLGTFSNKLSTDADLSETSLEQSYIDISAITDPRGNIMAVRPQKLVVTPTMAFTASKLMQSTLEPETGNNAINAIKQLGILPGGFEINHYLTDADAWFILTDQDGLICQKRIWPAEIRDDNDFETLDVKQATYFRLAFSCWNKRAVFGSAGA
jgi:hypothetical protein